jgi:tRNA dimethylallyltransferase
MTWFRREPEVRWLRGFGDEQKIQRNAVTAVEKLLATDSTDHSTNHSADQHG